MATATKFRFRFRIPTGEVIRPGLWMGDEAINAAVPTAEHAAMVAAGRSTVASSGFMDSFDSDTAFEECEMQNFVRKPADVDHPLPYWEAQSTTTESSGADIAGTVVGDSLPPNNSWCYTLYSSTPGPKGRNRMYGPALPESLVDNAGTIASGTITTLNADMVAILVAVAAAAISSVNFVVASAVHDNLLAVLTSRTQTKIRSQRARMIL